MTLAELLSILEYDQSPQFIPVSGSDELRAGLGPVLRCARKIEGVYGVYVFHSSRDDKLVAERPAIFIAEAADEDGARKIHRSLWNLGQAPFIIVLLPSHVRVYTGFDYSSSEPTAGMVADSLGLAVDVLRTALRSFSAESIDSGLVWQEQADALRRKNRVDARLLGSLRRLGKTLVDGHRLRQEVAHALIGKYVYIRYLRDRGILSDQWLATNDINLQDVLGNNASASGLRRLVDVLESRFNGGVFPLDFEAASAPTDSDIRIVASIFKGDLLVSRAMKQLSMDFSAYDFRYIPIELLSSIYEQFLLSRGGRRIGAIYTPEPLAEYLISEVNAERPLRSNFRILDPSCGSGIFLVVAYRRLIEQAREKRHNKHLTPRELVGLLEKIYGVEREEDACYVTEFSLLLTLLDYVEPPELHQNEHFRFPALHNTQIFHADLFDTESPFWKQHLRFDWIIGNPPWIEAGQNAEGEELAKEWISSNRVDKPVGSYRVSEAFCWVVGDLLSMAGHAGLVLHAKTLVNGSSSAFRKAFLSQHTILKVTNFANLRRVLFDGRTIAPAITMVYRRLAKSSGQPSIVHYGPLMINQTLTTADYFWALTVNESEIQAVPVHKAITGDNLVWKMALWGSYRDGRAIEQMSRIFPLTLWNLCRDLDWVPPSEGFQLRSQTEVSREVLEPAPYLAGRYRLNSDALNQSGYKFSIPASALDAIPASLCFIRKRGGKQGMLVSHAPHVLVSAAGTHAIYSDQYFAIPPRQIGLTCALKDSTGYMPGGAKYRDEDVPHLKALATFLSSSIVRYYLFFRAADWGIERDRITLAGLRSTPVPRLTPAQISSLAELTDHLATKESRHRQDLWSSQPQTEQLISNLQLELDTRVGAILGLPEDIIVLSQEFARIRERLVNQAENDMRSLVGRPGSALLHAYAEQLKSELDDYAAPVGIRHRVVVTRSSTFVVCTVQFIESQEEIPVHVEDADSSTSNLLGGLQRLLTDRFNQWVYVQKGLRIFNEDTIQICKPPRALDWSRTEALNDADDIISETLAPEGTNYVR